MIDSIYIVLMVVGLVLLILLPASIRTVDQATVAVVTLFGKYRRILRPGLNFLIPYLERISVRVPVQNQTVQLKFSAITNDQAAVHFTSTIIFTVSDHDEETIKLVAFKFIDLESFQTALTSAIEASVREYVATKKQADVLGVRAEIVDHAKASLDDQVGSWGYTIADLQINDISFDPTVMESMSRVVAGKNAQVAAEYEGQALLITRTKEAEAEGAAIRIAAENEAEELRNAGIDPALLGLMLWTETLRDVAKEGQGNTIFLDGNMSTLEEQNRRLQGIMSGDNSASKSKKPKKA